MRAFVAAYPHPLERHLTTTCDPSHLGWYDLRGWQPGQHPMLVAGYHVGDERGPSFGFRIAPDAATPTPGRAEAHGG